MKVKIFQLRVDSQNNSLFISTIIHKPVMPRPARTKIIAIQKVMNKQQQQLNVEKSLP